MDLLRLHPDTYLPDMLIEGYESLIWTERFRNNGELQLKTGRVSASQAVLPEGSLVTLRDSNEVMLIESHSLVYPDDGGRKLTIAGRSLETFLENRAQLGPVYREAWAPLMAYTDSEFISLLLWNHMVNATDQDPTFVGTKDALTAVPMVVVTNSSTLNSIIEDWVLNEGMVYQMLRQFLDFGELGVRNIRPVKSTGNIMTFDTSSTANRGMVTKTLTSNIQQLRMDVYNGTDRTRHQDVVPAVIFHYESGHIDEPEYFMSIKDRKDLALVNTSVGGGVVWPNTVIPPNTAVSGLNRRILYLDGGSMEDGADVDAFEKAVIQQAHLELSKHPHAVLFDGAISAQAPYEYNRDYFLGDRVTLMGEYGFEESMVISEYVRTQDDSGEYGYPGLVRKEEYDVTKKRTIQRFRPH